MTDLLTHAPITEIEDAHTSGAYFKRPITLARGQGCTVWDEAGSAYLDATSGQGVALLGHCHPAVTAAIAEQAETLITCPEIFYNGHRAGLYTLLASILPAELNRYFLGNSGAEANEGALKVATLLTGRSQIVAAKRGFHGRTMGALALTWNPKYREPFENWTSRAVTHVAFNDLDAAEQAITEETAAVVVEVVQGEGGVYVADPDYLQGLRRLCDERGVLLIIDEIQTGLGRTGRWFAFEHAGIVPDVVTLGKGLAGGVPMGAVCWRGSLGTLPQGTHGSTFGGNPLACAAALATLSTLCSEHLPARAAESGAWLLEALRGIDHPQIREVRGIGLILGLELRGRVTPVLKNLQDRGILALPAGFNVLRLLPPLIITQAEMERIVTAVRESLDE
ncbi:MAG: acetylornithine/succinylornithine family transaminase [Anaerolineae bacterium]|nr:acetylornithine/succinylornithine family transaminase [Anaerolineae bacterium]